MLYSHIQQNKHGLLKKIKEERLKNTSEYLLNLRTDTIHTGKLHTEGRLSEFLFRMKPVTGLGEKKIEDFINNNVKHFFK